MSIVQSGREYHHTTSYDRHQMAGHYLDWAHQPNPYKSYAGLKSIPLPDTKHLPKSRLSEVIEIKQSEYEAEENRIDIEQLSRILLLGYGFTARARHSGQDFFYRSAASAGALYPVEIYLAIFEIADLVPGLYHYSIQIRSLTLLREECFRKFITDAIENLPQQDIAACCFITGIYFRTAWKYRKRAMRYVLLDTGHVVENIRLALNAERVSHTIHYDFDDDALNRFMGLDENREVCLSCMPIYGGSLPTSLEKGNIEIEPLSELIQNASRVSPREVSYEEMVSLYQAGKSRTKKSASDISGTSAIGIDSSTWTAIAKTKGFDFKTELSFTETMFKRRSKRNYIDTAYPSDRYWRFLELVCGSARETLLRTHPKDIDLAIGFLLGNMAASDPGLYLLNPIDERIGLVRQGRFTDVMAVACLDQEWLINASLHFLFMSDLEKLDIAWGARGYRYAMISAGRIGQAIYLTATALGLGACGIGALYDGEAREIIGLNPESALLYLVAAGPVKRL